MPSAISINQSLEDQLVDWNDAKKTDDTCDFYIDMYQNIIDDPLVHESAKDIAKESKAKLQNTTSKTKYITKMKNNIAQAITDRDSKDAADAALIM